MDDFKSLLISVAAILAGVLCISFVQPVQAEYPIPTWTSGQPIDGRHVTKTVVDITTTSAVALSTSSIRMHANCQITAEGASAAYFYWDTIDPATSTGSKIVQLYDYFSPDDPVAWQGALYIVGSSTGIAVCHEYDFPEEWQ